MATVSDNNSSLNVTVRGGGILQGLKLDSGADGEQTLKAKKDQLEEGCKILEAKG